MSNESSREKSTLPSTEKKPSLEELDRALEEEESRLRHLPHGIHMGATELMDIVFHHPEIIEFFEKGEDVLNLNEEGQKRLLYLKQRYLDGALNGSELKELEESFFNPYFKNVQG